MEKIRYDSLQSIAWRIEDLIRKALDNIPEEFHEYFDSLLVAFEDEPPDDMVDVMGIYEGVPLIDRGYGGTLLPDSIILFKGPIERASDSYSDLKNQVNDFIIIQ